MKLILKQRKFSWLDTYDIYDEYNHPVYTIKGHASFRHSLSVIQNGKEIARLKEKTISFLPKYEIFIDGHRIGDIRKELTLFHPRFTLTSRNWIVRGSIFEYNYEISDKRNNLIASISKQIPSFTDTYCLDVVNEKDALECILTVLAIDIEKSQRDSENDSND